MLQDVETDEEDLDDEVDDGAEDEHEHESEDVSAEPAVKPVAAPPAPPKDTERQLSKKELKKKELAELDAVLAELGLSGNSSNAVKDGKSKMLQYIMVFPLYFLCGARLLVHTSIISLN